MGQVIDKHKFAKRAPDKNSEKFVVYVAALQISKLAILIYSFPAPMLAIS